MKDIDVEALAQDIYEQADILWAREVVDLLVKHKVAKAGQLDSWLAQREAKEEVRVASWGNR